MAWNSRRMLLGGAASVCIAMFGSALVWNTLRQQQPELAQLKTATPAAVATGAERVPDGAGAAPTRDRAARPRRSRPRRPPDWRSRPQHAPAQRAADKKPRPSRTAHGAG